MTTMTAKVQDKEAKGYDVSRTWAAVEEQREQMTAEAAGLTDSELQAIIAKAARSGEWQADVLGLIAEEVLATR